MTDSEWEILRRFMVDAMRPKIDNSLSFRLYGDMIMILNGSMCLMSITNDEHGFHYFWTFDTSRSGSNHVGVDLADPGSFEIVGKAIDNIVAIINAL